MLIEGYSIFLDDDMMAYLRYEAMRRGISVEQAYRDEIFYQRKAKEETLSPEELKALVAATQPDPRLLQGDEECPF